MASPPRFSPTEIPAESDVVTTAVTLANPDAFGSAGLPAGIFFSSAAPQHGDGFYGDGWWR
jgi:hypothetical protein